MVGQFIGISVVFENLRGEEPVEGNFCGSIVGAVWKIAYHWELPSG